VLNGDDGIDLLDGGDGKPSSPAGPGTTPSSAPVTTTA
jgi:hypothetical protein